MHSTLGMSAGLAEYSSIKTLGSHTSHWTITSPIPRRNSLAILYPLGTLLGALYKLANPPLELRRVN